MTLSTSEVAVCCSSDSLRSSVRWRSSLSSRVFSMAMTAWAAKFVTSSICLSVKGRTSVRGRWITPIGILREQRHAEHERASAARSDTR